MPTFVLRARHADMRSQNLFTNVGLRGHVEIIAHTLANAFYFSNGMRDNVEVYLIFDTSHDFPRTIKLSSQLGLSFPGFHEKAILDVLSDVLKNNIQKNQTKTIQPGIDLSGFGFDSLMKNLQKNNIVYLLDKKGQDIRNITFAEPSIFVLSDHLTMPKNSIKGLERHGINKISLGRKMLFASQCVILIHNELDRQFSNFCE